MKDKDQEPADESAEEQEATEETTSSSGGGAARALVGLLIGAAILGGSAYAAWHFWQTRPATKQFKPPRSALKVEATRLQQVDFKVIIPSQGHVEARAVSGLMPEVAGRIVKISPAFLDGEEFEADQELVWLDDRNYRIAVAEANASVRQLQAQLELERINRSSYENAVALAKANLSKSMAALELALARRDASIENLRRLNALSQSTPLARNEPQVKEANATVQASQAELDKAESDLKRRPDLMEASLQAQIDKENARLAQAEINLERTVVRAPRFRGRIIDKNADVGQHVTINTTLARAIAVDYAEVKLPVANSLIGFLKSHDTDFNRDGQGAHVDISATIGGRNHDWNGTIRGGLAQVNRSSQQNFVIAKVPNPYGKDPVLKDGQVVRASIHGKRLPKVFVIPRSAVRRGNFVLLIDTEDKLRRHRIISLWRDEYAVVVRQVIGADGQRRDLMEGEVLCLTNVDFAADSDKVAPTIDGVPPPEKEKPKKGRKP